MTIQLAKGKPAARPHPVPAELQKQDAASRLCCLRRHFKVICSARSEDRLRWPSSRRELAGFCPDPIRGLAHNLCVTQYHIDGMRYFCLPRVRHNVNGTRNFTLQKPRCPLPPPNCGQTLLPALPPRAGCAYALTSSTQRPGNCLRDTCLKLGPASRWGLICRGGCGKMCLLGLCEILVE